MAKVIPFKAVRPTREKVSLVASRSYQSYTQAELEASLNYNPFSFLHIVNPSYKYDKRIIGKERYNLVKNRYLEFKEDGIFIQDEKPNYYVYKIVNRYGNTFSGIVAAASAEDYKKDIIKKHEDTIEFRENIFKDYLKIVNFNAEPVLLTYPDNDKIASIISQVQKERAKFEFTTHFRDTHYLWVVDDFELVKNIQKAFETMKTIYITASDLKIYQFKKLVKDLNGLSKESFLIELDAMFRIENRGIELYKPTNKHHFSMYLDGEFKVGFRFIPITVKELKAIANEGLTMPPKSTFKEPKLRSGVTIYEF